MSILDFFRGREPTNNPGVREVLEMVTTPGTDYVSWNGKMYESDLIRSCIRPFAEAVGQLDGHHKIEYKDKDGRTIIEQDTQPFLRLLFTRPNPYMSGQDFQEKLANQYEYNSNAFALIVRDANGFPNAIYPIPCVNAEAIYDEQGSLYIRFLYKNGKFSVFDYKDIIHLRKDFSENNVFGTPPMAALSQIMEGVTMADQGIVKAIKNSGIVKWLLKFQKSMRPEDLRVNVKEFVKSYMDYETDTFGAAGVDSKVDATQVKPYDYVPNAVVQQDMRKRVLMFFGTNEKIIMGTADGEEKSAYYESRISPFAKKLSTAMTTKLLSPQQEANGEKIVYQSYNLEFAPVDKKIALFGAVDRRLMKVNEWRKIMGLPPDPDGDVYLLRLDTAQATGKEEGEK